jgi:hypothetical protein
MPFYVAETTVAGGIYLDMLERYLMPILKYEDPKWHAV